MANNQRVPEQNQNNDLPGWKDLAKHFGASAGEIGMKLWQLKQSQETFGLVEKLSINLKNGAVDVSTLRGHFDQITGMERGQCPVLERVLSNGCVKPEHVKDIVKELNQFNQTLANNIIYVGAWLSAIVIVLHLVKLAEIWAAVSNAKNVIEESRSEFTSIRQNLQQLHDWCVEVQNLMISYETVHENERNAISRNIERKVRRMNSLHVATTNKIYNIKMNINGKIEILGFHANQLMMDGIVNVAHGATNLIQYFQLRNFLSPAMLSLQFWMTAGFFGLFAADAVTYYITSEKLDDLRKTIREIKTFETELEAVIKIVNDAEDWLDEHNNGR